MVFKFNLSNLNCFYITKSWLIRAMRFRHNLDLRGNRLCDVTLISAGVFDVCYALISYQSTFLVNP